MVFSKTYGEPPFCEKEILRYVQNQCANEQTVLLLNECQKEARGLMKYKVCYCELTVEIHDNICDFGSFSVTSKNLATNLNGCKKVIVFAATVGIEIDRLIAKYSRLSPSKALIFQAIGTERVETLCGIFCADMAKEYKLCARPRFSPGYGDLPLETQRNIFSVLDCERKVGITLNNSLLMSPSKSVTAFLGFDENTLSEVSL